jgi:hypothetical protein
MLNYPTSPSIGPRCQTPVGKQIKNSFVWVFFTSHKYDVLQGVWQSIIIMRLRCCRTNKYTNTTILHAVFCG